MPPRVRDRGCRTARIFCTCAARTRYLFLFASDISIRTISGASVSYRLDGGRRLGIEGSMAGRKRAAETARTDLMKMASIN